MAKAVSKSAKALNTTGIKKVDAKPVADVAGVQPELKNVDTSIAAEVPAPAQKIEPPKPLDGKQVINKLMASYVKEYPAVKLFYIASDNQVFLASQKQSAVDHQAVLDKEKELEVYEVK